MSLPFSTLSLPALALALLFPCPDTLARERYVWRYEVIAPDARIDFLEFKKTGSGLTPAEAAELRGLWLGGPRRGALEARAVTGKLTKEEEAELRVYRDGGSPRYAELALKELQNGGRLSVSEAAELKAYRRGAGPYEAGLASRKADGKKLTDGEAAALSILESTGNQRHAFLAESDVRGVKLSDSERAELNAYEAGAGPRIAYLAKKRAEGRLSDGESKELDAFWGLKARTAGSAAAPKQGSTSAVAPR